MREDFKVANTILHVKIRHVLGVDRIGERNVAEDFHALLAVESHLLVQWVALARIPRPFHRLDESREFDDLRGDGTVEYPSRADRSFRRAALAARPGSLRCRCIRPQCA
jgi:hypothetical protein